MHPFMLKSFLPFFRKGSLLELGSFQGNFTRRFLPYFDDITCVEASDDAIGVAKAEFKNKVKFVNDVFETVVLPAKYDNIILTHVLEHIDDPVASAEKNKFGMAVRSWKVFPCLSQCQCAFPSNCCKNGPDKLISSSDKCRRLKLWSQDYLFARYAGKGC